jgi:hypothetical protein
MQKEFIVDISKCGIERIIKFVDLLRKYGYILYYGKIEYENNAKKYIWINIPIKAMYPEFPSLTFCFAGHIMLHDGKMPVFDLSNDFENIDARGMVKKIFILQQQNT